jgi:hypothetical protein
MSNPGPKVSYFLRVFKSIVPALGLLALSLFFGGPISAQHYYPGGLGNANLLIWLNAKKGVTVGGGGAVVQWGDQSGNAYNFVQAIVANKPVYSATSGPNLKPGVSFNATNSEYLYTPANLPNTIVLTAGISAFTMSNFSTPLTGWGWQRIFDFGNNAGSDNFMMGRYGATQNLYYEGWKGAAGDQVYTTSTPITDGVAAVFDFVQAAGAAGTLTTVQGYGSGTAQGMNGAAGSNITWVPGSIARSRNYIGRSNWAADEYFGGTMSEILIYNTAFNTTQRIIAENYLSQSWGQAVTTSKYTAPAANTYTTSLVGIGYTSAADNFLTDVAGSTDGLGFSSSAGATGFLQSAGYLIAAHNAQANTVIANASIHSVLSANVISEWNRSWQVQRTGGNAAGQVTYNFNFNDYNGTVPSAANTYALLYNATDGTFATGTNLLIPLVSTTVAGNIVAFVASMSNIANGYYTIIYSSTAIILPVQLTDFEAIRESGSSLLKWSVTTASDPARFDIERSTDAVQYNVIGSVPGNTAGNLSGEYSFTDGHPVAGANYYRLKMTDLEGNFIYSGIRSLDFSAVPASSFPLYPNPATDQLNVDMTGVAGPVDMLVIDARGTVVRTVSFSAGGVLTVPVRDLANGLYFVEIRFGSERLVRQLLKK